MMLTFIGQPFVGAQSVQTLKLMSIKMNIGFSIIFLSTVYWSKISQFQNNDLVISFHRC